MVFSLSLFFLIQVFFDSHLEIHAPIGLQVSCNKCTRTHSEKLKLSFDVNAILLPFIHVYVYTQNAHIHTHTYIQICFRSHYNLTIHVCVLEQPIHTTPTYQPPSHINHSISDRIRSSYIPIWSSHSFSYGRVSQTISYSFFLHSLACPPNHQSRLWTKKSVKLYTQHISSTAATSNHCLVSLRYTSQSQFSPSRIIHTRPAHILIAVFSSSSHLANSSIDYRALIRISGGCHMC